MSNQEPERTVALLVAERGAPFPARARREGLHYDDFVAVAQVSGESSQAFITRLRERIDRLSRHGAKPAHVALSVHGDSGVEARWMLSSVLATALARSGGGVLELQSDDRDCVRVRALAEELRNIVARDVTVRIGATQAAAA